MKKTFLLVLALVLVSLFSCSGIFDSDDGDSDDDSMDSSLVGSWSGTDEYGDAYSVVVAADGKIAVYDEAGLEEGVYIGTAANGKGDYVVESSNNYTLTGDSLVLGEGIVLELTRVGSGTGIVGSWTGSALFLDQTYTFKDDGTMAVTSSMEGITVDTSVGTYSISGNTLTTKLEVECSYSFSGTTLTLNIDGQTYTLTKV